MSKIFITSLLLGATLFAQEIPQERVELHNFKQSVELNAQVIQLENAQQSITSLVSGHLEKYFVKSAQKVKEGDRVALIESIEISKMSADYIALKKQLMAVTRDYDASKELYEKGMTSMSKLNAKVIRKSEIDAQLSALESQLETLGIDAKNLRKATAYFTLYAHSDGVVSALLKPLHSSVGTNEAVVSIVKNQAYYVKSFLPLAYASKVKVGDKIVINYANRDITTHITQILPKVDEVTQRVVLLSSVDEKVEHLFINTYLKSVLYFGDGMEHLAVKKSALSFFKNEWVVFVPKEDEHEEEHGMHHEDEHEKEHDAEGNGMHHEDEHEDEDEHDEHGDEEHQEVPFTLEVVKIITEDESYVAIEGLHEGEEYVSEKSYYVKSMLLKGSLGGHGH